MSGNYWRSLGQLEGSDESRQFTEREFPEGASELPDEQADQGGMTRRQMMTLLGASASLAGLAGCRRPVEAIVPYVNPPEAVIPGIPRRYATTMPFGRSAYGLVVESHEGRPTKIEGNSLHPSTSGASSVRAQAAILGLYDPDRGKSVILKGDPKTWAEFVAAWAELAKTHDADGGAGLAVLSESFASPTLARLKDAFHSRYPRARWATHESVSDENILAGLKSATGSELEPVLKIDRAAVILALDADLFSTDPEAIRHTQGFAAGRRVGGDAGAMNRLYAVEGASSLTGAMADHRLRIRTGQIASFVAALAARLAASGVAVDAPAAPASSVAGLDSHWLDVVAKDLLQNKGRGLIVAGRRQPPAVHAAVLALNVALGNVGETVTYHAIEEAALPNRGAVADLATAMGAGVIQTLVVLGGNPVFDALKDFEIEAALAKVTTVIAMASHLNETSRLATWHLPRAHFLEAWGDARAIGGPRSVVQPLILPLFGAHSDVELVGLLATGQDAPGYDLVRETWKPILGELDFEKKWNRILHDGLLAGSEPASVLPTLNRSPLADLARTLETPLGAGELEIVFAPSPALHDGRFANDAWLQELPDPITKITWDNPALLSPATAKALGVTSRDMVRLELRGRSLELPVWILPGQADETVTVTLGYGRRAAGRVGNGVGFDTNVLRSATAPDFDSGARLTRTGATYPISVTQEHGSMEGRPLVLEGTAEEYREHPDFVHERHHELPLFSLWKEHEYNQGHQWGMTIDLNACVGCNACVVACQSENNIPVVGKEQVANGREMHWIRIDRYFEGDADANPEMVFQPIPCMHCENAPCEQVCPVAATVHDAEGLNTMVYNRCIGTRYCSNNCPYKVRRFNFFNYTKDTPDVLALGNNPNVTVRSRGVMEKCTYCVQRINMGKIDAKLSGRELADGDVRTACQQACPASAIEFGDLLNPESRVSKLRKDSRGYALLADLNAKPRTTYLAKIRNPHPELSAGHPE